MFSKCHSFPYAPKDINETYIGNSIGTVGDSDEYDNNKIKKNPFEIHFLFINFLKSTISLSIPNYISTLAMLKITTNSPRNLNMYAVCVHNAQTYNEFQLKTKAKFLNFFKIEQQIQFTHPLKFPNTLNIS